MGIIELNKSFFDNLNIDNRELAKNIVKHVPDIKKYTSVKNQPQQYISRLNRYLNDMASTESGKKVKEHTCEWIAEGLVGYNNDKNFLPKNIDIDQMIYLITEHEFSSCNIEFDYKNPKDADITSMGEYLFHIDGDSNYLYSANQEWPGIQIPEKSRKEKLKELASTIISKSLAHPLYKYLYDDLKKNGTEARVLLQHSVVFNKRGEVAFIRPPVKAAVDWIKATLEETCKSRKYTEYDFWLTAGYLAYKASEGKTEKYYINFDDIPNELIDKETVGEITRDLKTPKEIQWTVEDDSYVYKFKIRLYRLVFSAFYIACKRNTVDELYNEISIKISTPDKSDYVHIENEFDDIVIFATALMLFLDRNTSDELIKKICSEANDYSVKNRSTQIGLIYILSYLLCENVSMTSKRREQVFEAAYSRTIYKLEQTEIERIFSCSTFYKTKIEDTLDKACKFTDNGEKTKWQPDYIFLYNYVNQHGVDNKSAKNFLIRTCEYRSQSWYGEKTNATKLNINDDLIAALNIFSDPDNNKDSLMYYVYGISVLGYVYSNEQIDMKSDVNKPMCYALQYSDNKINFLKALIFSDYYSRLYNPYYNDNCTNNPKMFLLCGAYRAICTGDFLECRNKLKQDDFSEQIYNHYKIWFKKECGRYKFLLGKLLLHLPIDDEFRNLIYTELKDGPFDIDFLNYDMIKIKQLEEKKYNPVNFLNELA